MSQIFFSKQDQTEKLSRLSLLASSRGKVVVWFKGSKDKQTFEVSTFNKETLEIHLVSREKVFPPGCTVLCTFELRGMSFFSETVFQISASGNLSLLFNNILFKSERRASFRLLTYPIYDVWVEFDLGDESDSGKVVKLKSKSGQGQTALFNNFLQLVNAPGTEATANDKKLKIRVQDLSATGMALHVGDIEAKFFKKDMVFHNVDIKFSDDVIQIPEVKIIYVVDYISADKKTKKYKLGVHFSVIPENIDDQLGRKINSLFRSNDLNKDFENFIK